jgi:hypothetical protein
MDGLVLRYILIELVRIFDRAVFHTGGATCAFALDNIPGFFEQGYLEISRLPGDSVNFRVGVNLYVLMPADLDQFRCKYSHAAVVGREGLVQLGHVAPDTGRLLHEVNLETRIGQIQRSLDAADPAPDNHDVAKIAVATTFTKLLNIFMQRYYVVHFLSPHQ